MSTAKNVALLRSNSPEPWEVEPDREQPYVDVDIESQLGRFPAKHQDRVRHCAAISPRITQLAVVFPALLHALATGYGPRDRRIAVVKCIEEGHPLAQAAEILGLPYCLRRLPPEACREPMAWVPFNPSFGRILGNHMPRAMPPPCNWLGHLFYAAQACDESFAAWVAKQKQLTGGEPLDARVLLPLALYAWHAQRCGSELQRLAFVPWHTGLGYKTVVVEAKYWLNRVKLLVYFGDRPITDTWLFAGQVAGYDFLPLTTFQEIMNERIAMRNCLDCYADKLAHNTCRLFSIRRNGARLAVLEIRRGRSIWQSPYIAQLKGPGNCEVAPDLRSAAERWIHDQSGGPYVVRRSRRRMPEAETTRKLRELLADYWDARQARTVEPIETMATLAELEAALVALALRGGISGWPFTRAP